MRGLLRLYCLKVYNFPLQLPVFCLLLHFRSIRKRFSILEENFIPSYKQIHLSSVTVVIVNVQWPLTNCSLQL